MYNSALYYFLERVTSPEFVSALAALLGVFVSGLSVIFLYKSRTSDQQLLVAEKQFDIFLEYIELSNQMHVFLSSPRKRTTEKLDKLLDDLLLMTYKISGIMDSDVSNSLKPLQDIFMDIYSKISKDLGYLCTETETSSFIRADGFILSKFRVALRIYGLTVKSQRVVPPEVMFPEKGITKP